MNCLTNLLPGWNILTNLTNCWSSTSESLRLITLYASLIHFTICIWCYILKHFPSFINSSLNNWCPIKMFIVLHAFTWQTTIAVTILHEIHYTIEVPKTKTDYWFSKYNRVLPVFLLILTRYLIWTQNLMAWWPSIWWLRGLNVPFHSFDS